MKLEILSLVCRLDCLSCVLTICSTILIGRRCWAGVAEARHAHELLGKGGVTGKIVLVRSASSLESGAA